MHDVLSSKDEFPFLIPLAEKVPDRLYVSGNVSAFSREEYKFLCVIGSRRPSAYGMRVCEDIIFGIAKRTKNVVIISGLAIGMDSRAHECAIAAGLPTVAFPGSGLNPLVLYPPSRRGLAERILDKGGALVSPFEPDQPAAKWNFPVRNELMATASHAVLVIEGADGSGTLHTAYSAMELGRDVMAVPGPVTSNLSRAPHGLIREGARLVGSAEHVLEELGIEIEEVDGNHESLFDKVALSPGEKRIMEFVTVPVTRDDIMSALGMDFAEAGACLTTLEAAGLILESGGLFRPAHEPHDRAP